MAVPAKSLCIALFLVVFAAFNGANGAGECGDSHPENEARKMASCAPALQNAHIQVASECCALAEKIVENPACMCAVAFSETIKSAGGKPEIAITIPKRCGINNRPVGYKCGGDLSVP